MLYTLTINPESSHAYNREPVEAPSAAVAVAEWADFERFDDETRAAPDAGPLPAVVRAPSPGSAGVCLSAP